jgi:hypothetical protein
MQLCRNTHKQLFISAGLASYSGSTSPAHNLTARLKARKRLPTAHLGTHL